MTTEWKLVPVEPTENMNMAAEYARDHASALRWTVMDCYRAMVEAAPQPPALGGEPEVVAKVWKTGVDTILRAARMPKPGPEWSLKSELIDRAHVAPLLAEIERLKAQINEPEWDALVTKLEDQNAELRAERDTLKALVDQVRDIVKERNIATDLYQQRMLNGQCMGKVCALFEAAPSAKDCA